MSDLVKRIDEMLESCTESDYVFDGEDEVYTEWFNKDKAKNDIIDLLVSEFEVRVEDIIGENDGVVLSYRTMKPRKTLDNTRRTVRDILRSEQRQRAKEFITQLQAMKEGRDE